MSDFLQQLVARSQGRLDTVQPLIAPRFATGGWELAVTEVTPAAAASSPPPVPGGTPATASSSPQTVSEGTLSPVPFSSPASTAPPAPPSLSEPSSSASPPSSVLPSESPASLKPLEDRSIDPISRSAAEGVGSLSAAPVPPPSLPPAGERIVQWFHAEIAPIAPAPAPPAAIAGPPGQEGAPGTPGMAGPAGPVGPGGPAGTSETCSPSVTPVFGMPAISPLPSPPLALPDSRPAPTVKVSIGRLEVRAVSPTPPAPVTKRPKPLRRPAVSLDQYLQQRSGRS